VQSDVVVNTRRLIGTRDLDVLRSPTCIEFPDASGRWRFLLVDRDESQVQRQRRRSTDNARRCRRELELHDSIRTGSARGQYLAPLPAVDFFGAVFFVLPAAWLAGVMRLLM